MPLNLPNPFIAKCAQKSAPSILSLGQHDGNPSSYIVSKITQNIFAYFVAQINYFWQGEWTWNVNPIRPYNNISS